MDLKELFKQKPFYSIETSIGKLCLFSISYKDQIKLETRFPGNEKSIDSCELARAMLKFTSFPEDFLLEDRDKPDSPVLEEDDLDKLTEQDLEKFAKCYVEHHPDLFRESMWEKEEAEDGKVLSKHVLGDIEHEKNEKESYLQYLTKLWVIQREKHRKQTEKMLGQVGGFSSRLTESIKDNLFQGTSLMGAMEDLRRNLPGLTEFEEPKLQALDLSESHRAMEEARQRPFNELAERLDQLIELSLQASDFAIKSNSIQTQVASEIKKSGDNSTKYSKANVILSVFIILLSIGGLGIAAYSSYSASEQSRALLNAAETATTDLNEQIGAGLAAVAGNQSEPRELFQTQITQLVELIETQQESASIIQQFQEQVSTLQEENSDLRNQVDLLSDRINMLQESND